jgi:hypothetical protein
MAAEDSIVVEEMRHNSQEQKGERPAAGERQGQTSNKQQLTMTEHTQYNNNNDNAIAKQQQRQQQRWQQRWQHLISNYENTRNGTNGKRSTRKSTAMIAIIANVEAGRQQQQRRRRCAHEAISIVAQSHNFCRRHTRDGSSRVRTATAQQRLSSAPSLPQSDLNTLCNSALRQLVVPVHVYVHTRVYSCGLL